MAQVFPLRKLQYGNHVLINRNGDNLNDKSLRGCAELGPMKARFSAQ